MDTHQLQIRPATLPHYAAAAVSTSPAATASQQDSTDVSGKEEALHQHTYEWSTGCSGDRRSVGLGSLEGGNTQLLCCHLTPQGTGHTRASDGSTACWISVTIDADAMLANSSNRYARLSFSAHF